MDFLNSLIQNDGIRIILAFLFSLVLSLYGIPVLVRIAQSHSMYDHPNGRTTHLTPTPRLAGIAMFLSVILSVSLLARMDSFPGYQFAVAGSVIIFFIGIKDDMMDISFSKKFAAQIAASFILIAFAGFRFTNLHGFFGLYQISFALSFCITLFFIIGITNAFNLIDGIDGLSGSLALTAFVAFGGWFLVNHDYPYSLLCASAVGSIIAFLRFNLYSVKNKIFLGDTGAQFLGFSMAMVVIHFNEMNISSALPWPVAASPVVSFGILLIPVYDTCRVMIMRMFRNQSPFTADRTHIHHYLLAFGFSHKQATTILFITSIFYAIVAFLLQNVNMYLGTALLLGSALFLTWLVTRLKPRKS
jgi:UDP-N-acetylmuramyl pentapeptide phosphotransferase/UDP-N-acetylglucosamine-1-phosphate transferase